jgi:hypothetical protein
MPQDRESSDRRTQFEQEADSARISLVTELWQFVLDNKKWWLLPILIAIGLVAAFMVLGSTGVAPFIYTLF